MTKRKAWRYKCDHCKKSGCSGAAIKTHEVRCFRNAERACSMCKAKWPLDGVDAIFKELETIEEDNEKELTEKVREFVEGCPACMCAIFMQASLPRVRFESMSWTGDDPIEGSYQYRVSFNYAKERDAYLEEMRREEVSYIS